MPPALWSADIMISPNEQAYWDGQSILTGTDVDTALSDESIDCSVLTWVFSRTTPSTFFDDYVQTSLAFVVNAAANMTSYLDASRKAQVEADAATLWGSLAGQFPSHYTLREYRWHDYSTSWTKPGPATRVTTVASAATGSSTTCVPDQIATTVTFKTASRLHWGRMYWPQCAIAGYTSTGRLTSGGVDTFSGYIRTFLNACHADGNEPVVRSTSHRAVLGITEFQMDNIPDVIRSRRAKQTDYRKVYTS